MVKCTELQCGRLLYVKAAHYVGRHCAKCNLRTFYFVDKGVSVTYVFYSLDDGALRNKLQHGAISEH